MAGIAAAQQVSVPQGRPNLTVAATEDKEITALKAEVAALKARVAETEKRLTGLTLLLSGLDKSIGAFREDFNGHYHPLNVDAHVGSDDLYVVVDGKNHFVKNAYGTRTFLTKNFVSPNAQAFERTTNTNKPALSQ